MPHSVYVDVDAVYTYWRQDLLVFVQFYIHIIEYAIVLLFKTNIFQIVD